MGAGDGTSVGLYREMYAVAEELLRLTKQLELTGQPDNIEKEVGDYTFLINKRDPMVQKLVRLKQRIDADTESDSSTCKAEWHKIERLIEELKAADKKHLVIMNKAKASVQSSLKSINSEKKVTNVYARPVQDGMVGLLDLKQ